ncbi:MAG: hypothetical protein RLZZ480_781 [Candidatus Parcubacteria bacterium]|jgi:hypothetical protein
MTSSLDINGKKMQSIKSAALHTGYSRDYITKLAREEKIVATQVGRNWFVDLDSLEQYASLVAEESKLRQQQLSEERKQVLRMKVEEERAVKAQAALHAKRLRRSKLAAVSVLILGLVTGFALQGIPLATTAPDGQAASTPFIKETGTGVMGAASAGANISAPTADASGVSFEKATFELSSLGTTEGVLLLPNHATTTLNPEELFSDEVKVMSDESGTSYVARVDEKGDVVEKIPFIVVPVTGNTTP